MDKEMRPGEVALPPGTGAAGALELTVIGHLRTPWARGDCPRNITAAREAMRAPAMIELLPPYAPGLLSMKAGDPIWVLAWAGAARRDLIVQAPRHASGPRGTFALRSPVRPNPILLSAARILSLDAEAGRIEIDASDAFDGTPVLDIKPWIARIDGAPPPAPEG